LRSAPEIHFRADESVARASRIESLLAQIRDEREQHEPMTTDDAPDTSGASED
jgi:ribosome-binding factor A